MPPYLAGYGPLKDSFHPADLPANLSANNTAGVFAERFSQDRQMFRPQLGWKQSMSGPHVRPPLAKGTIQPLEG